MSETKARFTLGPYVVEDVFGEGLRDICLAYDIEGAGRPILIATVYDEAGIISNDQATATAQLIASAPAMYDALKAAELELRGVEAVVSVHAQVVAALALADGKERGG